jgi:hypothetical protein
VFSGVILPHDEIAFAIEYDAEWDCITDRSVRPAYELHDSTFFSLRGAAYELHDSTFFSLRGAALGTAPPYEGYEHLSGRHSMWMRPARYAEWATTIL